MRFEQLTGPVGAPPTEPPAAAPPPSPIAGAASRRLAGSCGEDPAVELPPGQLHAFLSYARGLGRDNAARVAHVDGALSRAGFRTWCDPGGGRAGPDADPDADAASDAP
eukprot:gene34486-35626_t